MDTDTTYIFFTVISTSQVHDADIPDWAPIHKTLLKKKLNSSSTVFPASLSLFSVKKFRNHAKKANHAINFLVHNTSVEQCSSSKQRNVTTVEKCIVLHILKPRNPMVSSDPEVKMCLAYDRRQDI